MPDEPTVDPGLAREAVAEYQEHPTWILRFKQRKAPVLRESDDGEQAETEPEYVHVGSIRLEPTGKMDMDIRSPALHGLLTLGVFQVIDDKDMLLAQPESIDHLEALCVEAVRDRFVIERVQLEEDESSLMEAAWGSASPDWGGPAAPWSPLPLRQARAFILSNPNAQVEIVFPTVYEEDRSKKIADLVTAEAVQAISHERMSEQVAKELGQEQYDYTSEQNQIKLHPGPTVAMALGAGTPAGAADLVRRITGVNPQGMPGERPGISGKTAPKTPPKTPAKTAAGGHRPGMDSASRAAFRAGQRRDDTLAEAGGPFEVDEDDVNLEISEALLEAISERVVEKLRPLLEAAARQPQPVPAPAQEIHVHEAVRPDVKPEVHVHEGAVHVHPAPPAPAPIIPPAEVRVDVHVPEPPMRDKRITYDAEGRVTGVEERPVPPATEGDPA